MKIIRKIHNFVEIKSIQSIKLIIIKMKKLTILLFAFAISFTTFAQKDELKAAEKAIKKSDYPTAKVAVDKADALIANSDDKTKAKFYYLKGQTYAGLVETEPTIENFEMASSAFTELMEVEKGMGTTKYSDLAGPTMQVLISDLRTKGAESYQNKDYSNAKNELYLAYNLSKTDTLLLEYVANASYLEVDSKKREVKRKYDDGAVSEDEYNKDVAVLNKDFDESLDYFIQLKNMGYTGIESLYSVRNIESGKRENVGTESQMDLMVKTKEYDEPEIEVTESKLPKIIKNIASIYNEKGDNEKAIEAFKEARKVLPNDVNLIQNEAVLHYKLGNIDEYVRLINEAIELEPDNAVLYFNLGVISNDQGDIEKAKDYYRKAIEIKPDYKDAYSNLGSAMLEKDKGLVEEMNENLSNFDKYDAIKARQVVLYKEVIPIYEKAYELEPDDLDTIRTLMSLYENVEMEEKYKELRAIYDDLK